MCLRRLCKTCARGSPQKICAKDVPGESKVHRDCAKFVQGCTCTILAEDIGGGLFRERVCTNFVHFLTKFELFTETT